MGIIEEIIKKARTAIKIDACLEQKGKNK